jgi:hypothetical protein
LIISRVRVSWNTAVVSLKETEKKIDGWMGRNRVKMRGSPPQIVARPRVAQSLRTWPLKPRAGSPAPSSPLGGRESASPCLLSLALPTKWQATQCTCVSVCPHVRIQECREKTARQRGTPGNGRRRRNNTTDLEGLAHPECDAALVQCLVRCNGHADLVPNPEEKQPSLCAVNGHLSDELVCKQAKNRRCSVSCGCECARACPRALRVQDPVV